MDPANLAQAILIALAGWVVFGALMSASGSYGVFKLLQNRKNPSAKGLSILTGLFFFVFMVAAPIFSGAGFDLAAPFMILFGTLGVAGLLVRNK